MPLKPIDKRRPEERRQAVWDAIRRLTDFTLSDLWLETNMEKSSIQTYVKGLECAGFVTRTGIADNKAIKYRLANDVGIDAPRVRKDGTEVTQGRGREQMWRTMRILREFSPRDLAISASIEDCIVSPGEAKTYIHYLYKAGYVAMTRPGKPGSPHTSGNQARYRFIARMHTGPKPPMIQRIKQVYDPNLKRVVWPPEGGKDAGK